MDICVEGHCVIPVQDGHEHADIGKKNSSCHKGTHVCHSRIREFRDCLRPFVSPLVYVHQNSPIEKAYVFDEIYPHSRSGKDRAKKQMLKRCQRRRFVHLYIPSIHNRPLISAITDCLYSNIRFLIVNWFQFQTSS
jgi:hypothetical protein